MDTNTRLATDQKAGFAALVATHDGALRRYLRGLSRRTDVADDLAQQLWLKLLEAARAGRLPVADETGLRRYLMTAARNLFLDECIRKHGVARTSPCDPHTLEHLIGTDHGPCRSMVEDELERDQLCLRVRRAIGKLPEAQRAALGLWMAGSSIEHMTRRLAAPRDTVLSRKKYAFRRLRAALPDLAPHAA